MHLNRLISVVFFGLIFGSQSQAQNKRLAADDVKLTIRKIMDNYYSGKNFYFGASSTKDYYTSPDSNATAYFNEFSYNTPENSFKQPVVYATPNATWAAEEYRYFIKKAREKNQVIRAHGPISPQSSKWVRTDARTPKELDDVLVYYMTELSKDLEANKDVVKWMDVVNETLNPVPSKGLSYDGSGTGNDVAFEQGSWMGPKKGDNGWENPWTIMGFDTVMVDKESFIMPNYIVKAFELSNKYAPGVKKIWNTHGKVFDLTGFEKQKKAIKYLRSQGLKVDGIGWQAHVKVGWEKNPANVKNLDKVIDWCFANGLEFHVTELDVQVASSLNKTGIDVQALESSRDAQAETLNAVVELMLKKIGKGAVGINFWTNHDRFGDSSSFGSLFDTKGLPNPAYFKIKKTLLQYGAQ